MINKVVDDLYHCVGRAMKWPIYWPLRVGMGYAKATQKTHLFSSSPLPPTLMLGSRSLIAVWVDAMTRQLKFVLHMTVPASVCFSRDVMDRSSKKPSISTAGQGCPPLTHFLSPWYSRSSLHKICSWWESVIDIKTGTSHVSVRQVKQGAAVNSWPGSYVNTLWPLPVSCESHGDGQWDLCSKG